jgi:hypothetical protein
MAMYGVQKLDVPAEDAQMILGHARVSSATMQIYTHVDNEARQVALTGLSDVLSSQD